MELDPENLDSSLDISSTIQETTTNPYHIIFPIKLPKMKYNLTELQSISNNIGSFVFFVLSNAPLKSALLDIKSKQWITPEIDDSYKAEFVEIVPTGDTDFIILLKETNQNTKMIYYDTSTMRATDYDIKFRTDPLFSFFYERFLFLISYDDILNVYKRTMITMNTMEVTTDEVCGTFKPDCTKIYSTSNTSVNGKFLFHTNSETYPIVFYFVENNCFRFLKCGYSLYSLNPQIATHSLISLSKDGSENNYKCLIVSNFENKPSDSQLLFYNMKKFLLPEIIKITNFSISCNKATYFSLSEKAICFFSEESYMNLNVIVMGPPNKPPKPILSHGQEGMAYFTIPDIADWYLADNYSLDLKLKGQRIASFRLCKEKETHNIMKSIQIELQESESIYEATIVAHNSIGCVESDVVQFSICSTFKWSVRVISPQIGNNESLYHIEWQALKPFKEIEILAKISQNSSFEHIVTIDNQEMSGIDITSQKNYVFFRLQTTMESGEIYASTQRKKHTQVASRYVFSLEQKQYLEMKYLENVSPSKEAIKSMAEIIGCSEATVRNWFSNKRHRQKI